MWTFHFLFNISFSNDIIVVDRAVLSQLNLLIWQNFTLQVLDWTWLWCSCSTTCLSRSTLCYLNLRIFLHCVGWKKIRASLICQYYLPLMYKVSFNSTHCINANNYLLVNKDWPPSYCVFKWENYVYFSENTWPCWF